MSNYTLLTAKNTPGYDFEKGYTALETKTDMQDRFVPKSEVAYSVVVPKKVIRSGVSSTFKIDGNATALGCGSINGTKYYLAGFSDAGLYISTDFIKWEIIEGTENYSPVSICFGIAEGHEVFLISTFDHGLFAYTELGLKSINNPVLGTYPLREIYYNGSWKAAGYSGIFSSLNGLDWVKDSFNGIVDEEPSFYNIKFADNTWLAASDDGIWRYDQITDKWNQDVIEDADVISDISIIALEYIPADNLSNNSSPFWLAYCEEFEYSGLWKYNGTEWIRLGIDYPGITKIIYSNGVIYLIGNSGSYYSTDFGESFKPYINEAYNPEIYEIPNDAVELSSGGTLSSGKYKITSNLNGNIVVNSGSNVELYIGEDVELKGSVTHTIYVKLGGELTIYSNGMISNQNTTGNCSVLLNNGKCHLFGGRYYQYNCTNGTSNYWYHLVNHGELMELTNVRVEVSELDSRSTSSSIVNGYYDYNAETHAATNEENVYVENVNYPRPKLVIYSGYYKTPVKTHLVKSDDASTTIIYNGIFITTGGSVVLNAGNEVSIYGGSFIGYKDLTRCVYFRASGDEDISRGLTNIYGGRFIPHAGGSIIFEAELTSPINVYGGVFYKYFDEVSNFIKDPTAVVLRNGNNYIVNSDKSSLYKTSDIDALDSDYSINVLLGDEGNIIIGTNDGLYVDYLTFNSYYNHSYSSDNHPLKYQLDNWKSLMTYGSDDSGNYFKIRDWKFFIKNNKLKAMKVIEEN